MKENKIFALYMIFFISMIIFIPQKNGFCLESEELTHKNIKPVKVSLADEDTMKLLATDWLKEAEEKSLSEEKPGISYIFWTFLFIIIVIAIIIFSIFSSKITRNLSLKIKLYLSYFSLALLAFILGTAGYLYLKNVNAFSHQEAAFADMDMMASEIQGVQSEYLLHGIENKEYGEKMLHALEKKLEDFQENIENIKKNENLQDDQKQIMEELKENLSDYNKNMKEMVKAFQEIEKIKTGLDELGDKTDENLKDMIRNHQIKLKKTEDQGADFEKIKEQTSIINILKEMELLFLKLSQNELGFFLDKNPARVEFMAQELGLLMAYQRELEKQHGDLDEDQHTQDIEAIIKEYEDLLKKTIKDETVVEKDVSEMNGILHNIESLSSHLAHKAEKMADAAVWEAELASILFMIIIIIVAIFLSIFITGIITKPLHYAVEITDRLRRGDLTVDVIVESEDDTGQMLDSMKNMVKKLREIVMDIKEGAGNVASAATQLSSASEELTSSSQELSQGSSEQAASAEQASASMEQMAANIRHNADNATQTEKIAMKSSQDADQAGKAVSQTVSAMKEIAQKISFIEEIARQTDLLALNAAIEAARAGEHGKGFTVVASEVRKLAERSQRAANEINTLSLSSVEIAEKAGEMLGRLVPDIKKTTELVQEISAACKEQDTGADQINRAIQQLDLVIQQNVAVAEESSASSEEMSATAEEMSAQADNLRDVIEFFKIDNFDRPVLRKLSAKKSEKNLLKKSAKKNNKPKKNESREKVVNTFDNEIEDHVIDVNDVKEEDNDSDFEKY